MSAMNFLDWMKKQQALIELDLGFSDKFSSGTEKPDANLKSLANQVISTAPRNTLSNLQSSPNKRMAQQTMITTVNQASKKFAPRDKTYPIGDVVKAVDNSLGTNLIK